jgi:four helix bundle protein
MFSIEKLKVYNKALRTVAELTRLSAGWDKRHAVVDQLVRASERVVLNIAEGARLRGTANRQHFMDYAIGSALECAGCLDIAAIKCFVSAELALNQKQPVCEVVKMLVGLRKAWARDALQEPCGSYGGQGASGVPENTVYLFAHERLAAYQVRGSQGGDLSGSLRTDCPTRPSPKGEGPGAAGSCGCDAARFVQVDLERRPLSAQQSVGQSVGQRHPKMSKLQGQTSGLPVPE